MQSPYAFLALSDSWIARRARRFYWGIQEFTLPAPRLLFKPMLWCCCGVRSLVHFGKRLLICEPLFKAACTRVGKRVRTGRFLHYIQGRGTILIGDDVLLDGKSSFQFAVRFSSEPVLEIGDHTIISHNCSFTVGKRITIGRHCKIAANVRLFDSSGHPSDPEARKAGLPPANDEVRPVTVADNVWIGQSSFIFPGVTIGEGSVVAAGSVVMSDVPPNTLVAGNPARKIRSLCSESPPHPERPRRESGSILQPARPGERNHEQ